MIYFDSRRLINDGGEGTAAGTGSLSHTQAEKWGRGYKAFSPRPMSDVLPPARLRLPKAPYPHPTLPSSTSNWGPCVEIHFGGHFSFKTHINMQGW